MLYLEQLEKILNHITSIGIYVVRRDTHEMLYFNERVRAVAPDVRIGSVCHELWAGTCSNCPLLSIGDQESHTTVSYNDPFGDMVDITATKMLWAEEIPAYIITVGPHTLTKREQELEWGRRRMLQALSCVYSMVIYVNLTRNSFFMVEYERFDTKQAPDEGNFDELIEIGAQTMHPDFREQFKNTFSRKRLLEQFAKGETNIYMEHRQLGDDGEYHWTMTRVVQVENPINNDVLEITLSHNIDREKQLEEKLKVQHEMERERIRYQTAVESTDEVMFEYNVAEDLFTAFEGIVQDGARRTQRMVLRGYLERIETLGIVHPDYFDQMRCKLSGRTLDDVEIRMKTPHTQEYRWFRVHGNMVYENNRPALVIGMLRDITHIKQLELERESLERICNFTVNQDYNLVAIIEVPTETYAIRFCSLGPIYHIPHAGAYPEQVARIAQLAVYPDDRGEFISQLDLPTLISHLEQSDEECRLYCRILSNDGAFRWKRVRFTYYEGDQTHILLTIQDVQEVREAKDRELVSNRIFATAFRDLYDQVFEADLITNEIHEIICDEDGIQRVPTGRTLQEVIDYRCEHLIHPDFRRQYMQEMDMDTIPERLANTASSYFEIQRKTTFTSDLYHWYSIQLQFLSESQDSYKIMLYMRDIDQTRREDERNKRALRDALVLARDANRAKTDFISRMSHDIRTPMNAIIGMTTIAAANLGNKAKISDCLQKIDVSAKFLLSLINDILDMSKIESGKVVIARREFNFHRMIHGISSVFGQQAAQKHLAFNVYLEENFPLTCMGDELRINQVLMNLLGNAVKFTPEGGRVSLRIERKKAKEHITLVRFEVEDTGIGISPEFQKRIFDPFEQESASSGRVFEGTGLGMTITQNLVLLMDGRISLESELGQGTRFIVELPLELGETAEPVAVGSESIGHLRVLIVDDDVITCEHTQTILLHMGLESVWVTSGEQALRELREARAKNQNYDVAFIDWKIPGMDGLEIARRMRELAGPETLAIIMSAYDWAQIETEARAAGVDHFISKPIFPESVHNALSRAMQDAPSAQEPDSFQFCGERILLVEDNEINMEIARTLLEMQGLTVDGACNGQEAVDKFQASELGYYRVILMDIRMPVMDGVTATQKIRALPRADAETVPIIAMTANAFQEDEEFAAQMGMNGYLIKPIDTKSLFKGLNQLLNQGLTQMYI
ncbi:response regulator [Anaerotruncus colihominis]|uniref:Circadian input-output histidine kinase CikA n=2 Tax=Anaerotruncus colihominis TaxID=169435 RepID=A0A845RRD3_9FIRM|nr:response regulator [Anaerotruncus colihominis]NBI80182.1 response regulator [Anaerotruncus colihominis]